MAATKRSGSCASARFQLVTQGGALPPTSRCSQSVQPKRSLQTLIQSVPTSSPWRESSNVGFLLMILEGFGGVPFQSSLQPLVQSLPLSLLPQQHLRGAAPARGGGPFLSRHCQCPPLGQTESVSGATPGPQPFAPVCHHPHEQLVALPGETGMHTYTSNRFPPDGNGLFDRNTGKIHKQ